MKIEIFKAGTQTDSAGNSRAWTEADLDSIAASYDPSTHEAPVCIGHPKDNAPAYGWVKSVTREGKSLFAEIGDLVDEFSEMLSKKMFKKRSISLYPDLSLRHIGFLGAMPPAVKGLKDFAFAESPVGFEYMDWDTAWSLKSVGRLFQGIRDYFIDTKDLATADRLVPQYEIDGLKAAQATPEEVSAYSDTLTEEIDMNKVQELEAQIATFKEQLATASGKITEFEGRAIAAEAKVSAMVKEKTVGALASFCDKMEAAGKMLPAHRAANLAIMESLSAAPEMDFSEGEGDQKKTVKKSPLAFFQENVEKAAPLISFGEIATKDKAATAVSDDKLVTLTKAKMDSDKSLNYSQASALVLKENPDLNFVTAQ